MAKTNPKPRAKSVGDVLAENEYPNASSTVRKKIAAAANAYVKEVHQRVDEAAMNAARGSASKVGDFRHGRLQFPRFDHLVP